VSRPWHWIGRRLPQGRRDALRQLGLVAFAYYLYRMVRGMIDGEVSTAFENARLLVDAERAMGLFFEPALQAWALTVPGLIEVASALYVNTHFLVTTSFIAWLYLRRNDDFYVIRDMFMVSMGVALACYLLFPTAPPRMLPEWGFTDSVVALVGRETSQGAEVLFNPYAAVPSMHVAFALMVGLPAARLVSSRGLKIAWYAYPGLVTFVVVLTANHYWLDAVFGAMVAAFAARVAFAIQTSREALGAGAPA
jgi:membrane-associated phospholipid phosphatase